MTLLTQAGDHHSGERHGDESIGSMDKQAHRLKGMSHDPLHLVLRLLMQELHARHLLAVFGDFDSVADEDQASVDAQGLRK